MAEAAETNRRRPRTEHFHDDPEDDRAFGRCGSRSPSWPGPRARRHRRRRRRPRRAPPRPRRPRVVAHQGAVAQAGGPRRSAARRAAPPPSPARSKRTRTSSSGDGGAGVGRAGGPQVPRDAPARGRAGPVTRLLRDVIEAAASHDEAARLKAGARTWARRPAGDDCALRPAARAEAAAARAVVRAAVAERVSSSPRRPPKKPAPPSPRPRVDDDALPAATA